MPATEFGGTTYSSMFKLTASALDLANHTAVASLDTTITSSLVKSGDTVIAVPPATLEAGIAVQGTQTVSDGSFKLRTTNASAGAINPAGPSPRARSRSYGIALKERRASQASWCTRVYAGDGEQGAARL